MIHWTEPTLKRIWLFVCSFDASLCGRCECMGSIAHVGIRGQLVGVSPLFPACDPVVIFRLSGLAARAFVGHEQYFLRMQSISKGNLY